MKQTKTNTLLLLLCILFGVSGCSWIPFIGGKEEAKPVYRETPLIPRLTLPSDVNSVAMEDLYPIPEFETSILSKVSQQEVPQPKTIVANTQEVRAFKSGDEYWVSTSNSPAEGWARVRRFWELNSIPLELEIPYRGVMETNWLSREVDGVSSRDKFRIRVEHGMHEKSSEIYIMHLGFPADDTELPSAAQLDWSQVTENDEVTTAMMQELASFLIDTEYEGAPASLLAQSFSGSPKSSLGVGASGDPVLLLSLDFNRAWESIGKAIDDSELELEDLDRSTGNYYVNYYPEAQEGGGFLSFFGIGKGSKNKGPLYRYLVRVATKNENQIEVAVSSDDPKATPILTDALLEAIRTNLI